MSNIRHLIASYQFNRVRTLALLDKLEGDPQGAKFLAWRPSEGRAHAAWQFMHIGITEELFATDRLTTDKKHAYADLVPRFRGGSVPDDDIPTFAEIRKILSETREHLLATLATLDDSQLSVIPEGLKDRKLTLHDALHILTWHEAHHHGQIHFSLNSFRAENPSS